MKPHDFRVLVVDDDPDMASVLARMIQSEGMRADTVLDGEANELVAAVELELGTGGLHFILAPRGRGAEAGGPSWVSRLP